MSRGQTPAPPHVPIIPPGMAYAARCANEAMKARLEREAAIRLEAIDSTVAYENQDHDA